jgi:tRNA A37 threonylcarbamoyladenosine dehydratase
MSPQYKTCEVVLLYNHMFYTEETYEDLFNNYDIDYFIDASDTIIYKVHLMSVGSVLLAAPILEIILIPRSKHSFIR